MRYCLILICLLAGCRTGAAQQRALKLNKDYRSIAVAKGDSLSYELPLHKNGIYQFSLLQQGIAIHYQLLGHQNRVLYESNYPDDINGDERFEFAPPASGTYTLKIQRFNDPENTDAGHISLYIKSLSKPELATRAALRKALEPENAKSISTLDVTHFWQAYDKLVGCRNFADSVATFQQLYLDQATNGMLDFIQARELTAEKYVRAVRKHKVQYEAVRINTLQAEKAVPIIEELLTRFTALYPNLKPFKVCFAIGIQNTGGTVSKNFVLIGTEVAAAMGGTAPPRDVEIRQRLRGIVAHECVHTQQKLTTSPAAIKCDLLYKSLYEGAADFIGELVSGNKHPYPYGDAHEQELWLSFKSELCNQTVANWLYNGNASKNRPADLGYFIGYRIVQAYYTKASDKRQALADIIGLNNPIKFLELSAYDAR